MRTRRAISGLAVALLVPMAAVAAPPGAPSNDDYLDSLRLNEPGKRLNRTETLRDTRDTSKASVQTDVFAPQNPGGPPEPTTCGAASIGRTVWYDFYPDVHGFVRLRGNGYDTSLAVVPFNSRTAVPSFGQRRCLNQSSSTTEEFLAEVAKGRAYTVQVGAVGGVGGNLEFLFDFLPDTDADGVLDEVDKCDRLKGSAREAGCPVRLNAGVTLRALPTSTGIRIVSLRVKAPRRSRVSVTCSGCGSQVKTARTVGFGRLRGKSLRAGSKLVIRVTRRNSIGTYVSYRISPGNFRKTERCLNPGSRKPRRRCG